MPDGVRVVGGISSVSSRYRSISCNSTRSTACGEPCGNRYAAGAGAVVAPDRAGFLEGAAGIALALHGYANDEPAKTGWDTALLLD